MQGKVSDVTTVICHPRGMSCCTTCHSPVGALAKDRGTRVTKNTMNILRISQLHNSKANSESRGCVDCQRRTGSGTRDHQLDFAYAEHHGSREANVHTAADGYDPLHGGEIDSRRAFGPVVSTGQAFTENTGAEALI